MFANNNAKLLYGRLVADKILQAVKQEVSTLKGRPPCVVFLRVGNDGASVSYVKQKSEKAAWVGIKSELKVFDEIVTETKLLAEIDQLNKDETVDGILVQSPLPKHLNFIKIVNTIKPEKDVDGFGAYNCGYVMQNVDRLLPCTPAGIVELLRYYGIKTARKQVVIVNRSLIVGKPLGMLLLKNSEFGNATVTFCHSHSANLQAITRQGDILILACGNPHFFGKAFVKKGAVVVDVGITRVSDSSERGYILHGDADYKSLMNHVSAITPVPGGVGPMTVAMLMKNTLKAYFLCHPV